MALTKVSYSMITGAVINAADFGFSTSASSTDNANAIMAAINFIGTTYGNKGGTVYLPSGIYNVAPDIIKFGNKSDVTLTGATPAYAYDAPFGGTRLNFSAGNIGIDTYDAPTAGLARSQGIQIRNMTVDGVGVLEIGIRVTSNHVLEDLSVTRCVDAGINLTDLTNSAHLNRVTSYNNTNNIGTGYGLWVEGTLTTIFNVSNSNFRLNNMGVRIEAGRLFAIQNTVIESNNQEGIYFYRPGPGTPLDGTLTNVWFEANYRDNTAGYSVVIDAATKDTGASTPTIKFNSCLIAPKSPNGRHLAIYAGRRNIFTDITFTQGDFNNGIYLEPGFAIETYINGPHQMAGFASGSRQFSALPTSWVPWVGTFVSSSKVYHVAKRIVQPNSTGPTTIFTLSSLFNGDYGTIEINLAGIFPGADLGYRSYIGVWSRVSGVAFATLSPVNIDSGAVEYGAGDLATITTSNSSGELLIQLTLGAFIDSFTGTVDLKVCGGVTDISVT
jgi:hypothetical protein